MSFSGFPPGKTHLTPVPAVFFSELLPEIDDLAELKITLYAIWALDRQEGSPRFMLLDDFLEDANFLASLGAEPENQKADLLKGLESAVCRGTFLRGEMAVGQPIFFLNSERGRAALSGMQKGVWIPQVHAASAAGLVAERPNIFRLYEENIGPLTPLIADDLRAAEQEYSPSWIEEAMHLAVQNNARSWRYIQSILHRWKDKGKHEIHRQDSSEDRRGYIQGELSDLIEH
jgi:DNA replication protein